MNLFSWLRDGVRHAVLQGVSDAVGDIGTPPQGEDINQRILQLLQTSSQPTTIDAKPQERLPRKKLGRSLDEIAGAKMS